MSRRIAVTVFKHSPVCYWSAKHLIPPQTRLIGWVGVTVSSCSNRLIFWGNQPVNGLLKVDSVHYSVYMRKYFNNLTSPLFTFFSIKVQKMPTKSADWCVSCCISGWHSAAVISLPQCVRVCVPRAAQCQFVLLSGSLKSSSSLDSKPGLMTRPIHWHLSALWAARRTAQPKTRADRQHHRVNTSSEG